MTPATQALLLFRGALAIGALLAGWFLWGQFTDWIKADERAAREKAEASAAGWKQTAENEQKAKDWLNKVATDSLLLQAKKEAELKESRRALDELKRSNPEVQKWADTRIPDAVFRVRPAGQPTQPTDPTVVRDPNGRTATSAGPPGREAGQHESSPVGSEPILPGTVGNSERPAEKAGDVQVKPSLWDRISNKWMEILP